MLKTAMSDWGAIPFPTLITLPKQPLEVNWSRLGVRAASRGVSPPSNGCGKSPTPSNKTYIAFEEAGLNPKEQYQT